MKMTRTDTTESINIVVNLIVLLAMVAVVIVS